MQRKVLNRKKINPAIPIFTGKMQDEKIDIQLFQYNTTECHDNMNYNYSTFNGFESEQYQNWLNVHGLHNTETIQKICKKLNSNNLEIQDILDVNQRPKLQEYENHLFCSLKSISYLKNSEIKQEQLSFILGTNFLVSFQENKADYFEHIRHRLRDNIGTIRKQTPDYLLYTLIESILDNYFNTVNSIDNQVAELNIIDNNILPTPQILQTIERYKRQLHKVKQTITPIKEFISKLERENTRFIAEQNMKYFHELKDLCLSLIDECEYIEVRLESNTNLLFSIQGHKMNQIMKTLTIVSTIFIPLTFIAGIYGMNFKHMPELDWEWGYISVWVLILLILFIMLIYFKKKKWY